MAEEAVAASPASLVAEQEPWRSQDAAVQGQQWGLPSGALPILTMVLTASWLKFSKGWISRKISC